VSTVAESLLMAPGKLQSPAAAVQADSAGSAEVLSTVQVAARVCVASASPIEQATKMILFPLKMRIASS
jgi:hypothetical protein